MSFVSFNWPNRSKAFRHKRTKMPVDIEEFLQGIGQIADHENIRFTVKQSGKGALVCGGLCFVGGLLGGPVGMAVGGTLGGITAYRMTGSEYYWPWVPTKMLYFFVTSLEIIFRNDYYRYNN